MELGVRLSRGSMPALCPADVMAWVVLIIAMMLDSLQIRSATQISIRLEAFRAPAVPTVLRRQMEGGGAISECFFLSYFSSPTRDISAGGGCGSETTAKWVGGLCSYIQGIKVSRSDRRIEELLGGTTGLHPQDHKLNIRRGFQITLHALVVK